MKRLLLIILFACTLNSLAYAQESGKRSKNINFEDELIEGINRKPLDAFNQISEQNKRRKNHLYRKRAGFTDRDESLAIEMRLAQ
ncbi:MAG: hypothetical protein H7333_07425 [Bdellovibrionales bacterium]|nr:hypothetical protein [Oligoflexia bacterium]